MAGTELVELLNCVNSLIYSTQLDCPDSASSQRIGNERHRADFAEWVADRM